MNEQQYAAKSAAEPKRCRREMQPNSEFKKKWVPRLYYCYCYMRKYKKLTIHNVAFGCIVLYAAVIFKWSSCLLFLYYYYYTHNIFLFFLMVNSVRSSNFVGLFCFFLFCPSSIYSFTILLLLIFLHLAHFHLYFISGLK